MVFFNYATMQMAAKIVYYGPGLCGKTTNLHFIYGKTSPGSRGEMVSLETETDRTLFFDLLPLDVGTIGGFKTRLQLYTVPGQVFYNTTRKLVLRGVDGLVFVADSQRAMKDANIESFQNMELNLKEIGLTATDLPLVVQFNKRDLANILPIDELAEALDPEARFAHVEAAALKGDGVFETLKEISKLTLRSLKKKMSGEEFGRTTRRASVAAVSFSAPSDPAGTPATGPQAFGEEEIRSDADEVEEPISLSDLRADAEAAASALAAEIDSDTFFEKAEAVEEIPTADIAAPSVESRTRPDLDVEFIPEAEEDSAPEVRTVPAAEETDRVEFDEAPAQALSTPGQIVKHVKVRSNVDILSELEKLRKNATLKPISPATEEAASPAAPSPTRRMTNEALSIDDLLRSGLNHRKEVQKLAEFQFDKGDLTRAKRMTITVRLNDQKNGALGSEQIVDVPLADMKEIEKLLVSLKLHITGK